VARAAFIGDANAAYCPDRFDRLAHGASGGWHWPGMLVTWYWMLYRKMWVPALIYFFAPYLIVGGSPASPRARLRSPARRTSHGWPSGSTP
jgi:hypothetical protein